MPNPCANVHKNRYNIFWNIDGVTCSGTWIKNNSFKTKLNSIHSSLLTHLIVRGALSLVSVVLFTSAVSLRSFATVELWCWSESWELVGFWSLLPSSNSAFLSWFFRNPFRIDCFRHVWLAFFSCFSYSVWNTRKLTMKTIGRETW